MTDPIVPVTGETEKPPWEQRPGEPNRWYVRFRAYLDLGHSRTILAAYRRVARTGKTTVSSQWYAIASQWQWDSRAAAYDEHIRSTLQEQEAARRFDMREERLGRNRRMLDLLFRLILDHLSSLEGNRIGANFNSIRSLYRDLLEMERAEMGYVYQPADATLTADDMIKMRDSFYAFLARPPAYAFPAPKETDPEVLAAAEILCELYPAPADAERLAAAVGLQRRHLDLTGSPLHNWRAVVTAAHDAGSLIGLISASLRDDPGNARLVDLLRMNL